MTAKDILDEFMGIKESATDILNKKKMALQWVHDTNIDQYLFDRLSKIYKQGVSIYDVLKNDKAQGECHVISASIITVMNPKDMLVNGNLLPEDEEGWEHQWIEFYFDGYWYILDNISTDVYYKDKYYNTVKPKINFSITNKEWMSDDYSKMHAQIIKIPECSHDLCLFNYYQNYDRDYLRKIINSYTELDNNGNVKCYKSPHKFY